MSCYNRVEQEARDCRDNAGRRSFIGLTRSGLFKVTDFDSSQNNVCDFLLVNNSNLNT